MALLGLVCLLIMGGVGYTYYREGLLASFAACISAILSCMIAFQVWPYIANELEPAVKGTFLEGCEDALVLSAIFAASFALMRLATVHIVNRELDYTNGINRVGGVVFGVLTGYFVSGFVLFVAQTLPLEERFLGFQPPTETGFTSRFLPSDQNLLKLMEKSRTGAFRPTDDPAATFGDYTLMMAKSRRFPDPNTPAPQPEQPPTPKPKAKKEKEKENLKLIPMVDPPDPDKKDDL